MRDFGSKLGVGWTLPLQFTWDFTVLCQTFLRRGFFSAHCLFSYNSGYIVCLYVLFRICRKFRFLPAIMVTVIFAKWVGDWLTHGLYHELLHVKHIPFLSDAVPKKLSFRLFGELKNSACIAVRLIILQESSLISF